MINLSLLYNYVLIVILIHVIAVIILAFSGHLDKFISDLYLLETVGFVHFVLSSILDGMLLYYIYDFLYNYKFYKILVLLDWLILVLDIIYILVGFIL